MAGSEAKAGAARRIASDHRGLRSAHDHLNSGTVRGYLTHVRKFYDEAQYAEPPSISRNPAARVRVVNVRDQVPDALTEEQARMVLRGIRNDRGTFIQDLMSKRDYALVLIAMTLGPRRRELTRLAWSDRQLSFEAKPILKTFGKKQKHHANRLTPSGVRALDDWEVAIADFIGRPIRGDDAMFPPLNSNGGRLTADRDEALIPMSPTGLGDVIRRRLIDAGLEGPRLGPHRLRRTAATLAHLGGADPVDTQFLLDHAKLETTVNDYIRPIEDLRRSAAAHSPLSDFDPDVYGPEL